MSGSDFSDESPQMISEGRRRNTGFFYGYRASVEKSISIPLPGLKKKSQEELGIPGVGWWTRSLQATSSKFAYLLGLFVLFLPLIVYAVTLGNYFHPNLYWASLFGIFMLASRLNTSRKLAKNGATLLKLDTNPEVGGQASGIIRFVKPLRGSQAVDIKLVCMEKDAIRTQNSTSDAEYWSIKQTVPVRPEGRESIVTFNFDLPADLPGDESFRFYWRLELRGTASNKDLCRSWRMPVGEAGISHAGDKEFETVQRVAYAGSRIAG